MEMRLPECSTAHKLQFEKLTLICGGAGSGKSSLLKTLVDRQGAVGNRLLIRHSPLQRTDPKARKAQPSNSSRLSFEYLPFVKAVEFSHCKDKNLSVAQFLGVNNWARSLFDESTALRFKLRSCMHCGSALEFKTISETNTLIRDGFVGTTEIFGGINSLDPLLNTLTEQALSAGFELGQPYLYKGGANYVSVIIDTLEQAQISEDRLLSALRQAWDLGSSCLGIRSKSTPSRSFIFSPIGWCSHCGPSTPRYSTEDFMWSVEQLSHLGWEESRDLSETVQPKIDLLSNEIIAGLPLLKILTEPVAELALEESLAPSLIHRLADLCRALDTGPLNLLQPIASLKAGEQRKLKIIRSILEASNGTLVLIDDLALELHPTELEKLLGCLSRECRRKFSIIATAPICPVSIREESEQIDCLMLQQADTSIPPKSGKPADLDTRLSLTLPNFLLSQGQAATATHFGILAQEVTAITGLSYTPKRELLEYWRNQEPLGETGISVFYLDLASPFRTNSKVLAGELPVLKELATLFVMLPIARSLGATVDDFIIGSRPKNSRLAPCEECCGIGSVHVKMVCNKCLGKGLHPQLADLSIAGRSMKELLQLSLAQLYSVFSNNFRIKRTLDLPIKLGLGSIALGRLTESLSPGEREILRLVKFLSKLPKRCLALVSSAGERLGAEQSLALISALREQAQQGATIVLSTNNPILINQSLEALEIRWAQPEKSDYAPPDSKAPVAFTLKTANCRA